MTKIVTIGIPKGGSGKTSLALALAAGLTQRGYTTLSVDLDMQGNFSFTAGASRDGATVFGMLTGECAASDAIQHTAEFGDVIASSRSLAGADATIRGPGREYRLRDALAPKAGEYDFCLLDTPPAVGVLVVNALAASDTVLIPVSTWGGYDLQGVNELWDAIQPVREYCNPRLEVEGIVLNRFNGRSIMAKGLTAIIEQMAAKMGTRVYRTTIRTAQAIGEAQLYQQSIFRYAPRANVTGDYQSFINEFLEEKANG